MNADIPPLDEETNLDYLLPVTRKSGLKFRCRCVPDAPFYCSARKCRNYRSMMKWILTRCGRTQNGCLNKGLWRCTGCLRVVYCSKECQLVSWSGHRESCRLVRRE